MSKNRTLADFISTSSVSAEEIANGAVTVVKLANTTSSNGTSLIQMSGHSTALNITADGNVGIGTNNPLSRLHVNNTSSAFYMGYGSNQDIYLQTTNGNILFTDYNAANERMRIDSNGNVGIGTSSIPTTSVSHLKINTNTFLTDNTYTSLAHNAYWNSGWKYNTSNAATLYQIESDHVWYTTASGSAGGAISFSERMRIDSSGNVGIGTSSPAAELHVYSSGQAIARVEGANQYYSGMMIRNNYASQQSQWHVAAAGGTSGWGAVNGNFIIRDDTTNSTGIEIERGAGGSSGALYIDSDGKVGIGSTAPATELEVVGTVYATAVDHGDGSSATRAATSALEILRYYGKKPSGNYWIKEPNNGTPRQIYCDMETDGGGWMLWLEYNTSQNSMGAQGTQSNLAPAYNNGYANYEVMLDGSDVNNINKRSIRGVYELDANGEIRANGMRQWGEHHLPEHVGNPFVPNSDTFFNDAADGEFIQRTNYYSPLAGASGGWTSIGSGSLFVYVREPNPLVRNGDIKTYYGMPLVYDYYDSSKFGWHVPDYAYATGELGMTPGFSGIAIDGTDFPLASGYSNRRIDVNNGNNGPSAQGMLRGYLIGEFQIRFYLGYRWGWSELVLIDVKQAYESKYLGGAGSNIQKNIYRVMNNNSNNYANYVAHDSAGTQTTQTGTAYSEGQTWVMWRQQNGNIYVKDPGGTSRNLGKFVGPMVAMSGQQSPHMLEIRDVWSRGRNSVTSNSAGTSTQFRH